MKCNLCNQEKELIKKSHIIPDFFYREAGIYDNQHRINKIEVKEFLNSKKVGRIPTGDYEGGILCADCDNKLIGGLEDYGRKVLFGGLFNEEAIENQNFKNPTDGLESSLFKNVDYTKFKLFLLSILWRASITKREIFKEARLSASDNEKLRKMLINKDAGKVNEYPIIFLSYLNDQTIPTDVIFQPIRSATKDIVTFLIGGFIFIYNITDNYQDINEISDLTITPENKMTMMHLPRGSGWDFILRFADLK
jgi:hypothetical protein